MPQCQSLQAWSLMGVYAGAVCVENHSCNLSVDILFNCIENAILTTVTVQLNSENINSHFKDKFTTFPCPTFYHLNFLIQDILWIKDYQELKKGSSCVCTHCLRSLVELCFIVVVYLCFPPHSGNAETAESNIVALSNCTASSILIIFINFILQWKLCTVSLHQGGRRGNLIGN